MEKSVEKYNDGLSFIKVTNIDAMDLAASGYLARESLLASE